jgi:hypothetical protein
MVIVINSLYTSNHIPSYRSTCGSDRSLPKPRPTGYRQQLSIGTRFTIGEPLTATLTGQDGIITQGFHQGTITVTSVREELPAAALSVHPNPAVDRLVVTSSAEGAEWHLHTLDGKAVMHGTLQQGHNEIDVTALAQATYMLTVEARDRRTNAYRIIKTQ